MKSSAICAATTKNSSRKKNIIFAPLLRTHPPDARDRPLASIGLVHPVPERENFLPPRRASPTGKHRLLRKYKLSGSASSQPASIKISGLKTASIPLSLVRQRRSPARGFLPPRPRPCSFHLKPTKQPRS